MSGECGTRYAVLAAAMLAAAGARAGPTNTVTLARHATVAEFEGTSYHRCMGLTSLCPDQCGESGTVATFTIVAYEKYEKLGEYGDPKCAQFVFMIEDNRKNPRVPAAIRNTVKALNKGDRVLLSWDHNYVTVDGCSSPERPVTKLQKKDGAAAARASSEAK